MELEINLKPNEDVIFLMRKIGAATDTASYKVANYTRLTYETEITIDEFREKGKKTQIIDEQNNHEAYN